MITKTIETVTGKIEVSIPTTLEEVSLGMLLQMQDDKSPIELISLLSGVDIDELYMAKNPDEFEGFNERIQSLSHQIRYGIEELDIPKYIMIAGRKVSISDNLSIEPVGAFMECRNIITDEINEYIKANPDDVDAKEFNPSLEAAALILAHYLYSPATGLPYNDDRAVEFKDTHVLKLSVAITIPIAKAFFLLYPHLWKPRVKSLKGMYQRWKRKQVLKNFRSSATTTR